MSGRTPFPLPANPMVGSSSQQQQSATYANYGYGAYNPAFAFRQALFPGYQALPQTPAGYTYSSTYTPEAEAAPAAPVLPRDAPPRRSRPQEPGVGPWRNCCQAGCSFTGPDETVNIHEGDRHLIFPNGKPVERSEEEERALKRGGPTPTIQGTSIRLDTEDDIAAWIAERKARWPSKEKLEQQENDKKDRIARGEAEPLTRGKRGRGGKARGGGRTDATSRAEDWGRPEASRPDTAPTRGRGRGRGRGGAASSRPIKTAASSSGSSSSDSSSDSDSESDSESDVEAALAVHVPAPVATAVKAARQPSKRPCKYFQQRGKCRNGDNCNFSHDVRVDQPRPQMPAVKPSLLGSMLQGPIESTLSQLTQTIRFLVANDMLEGVELKAGDAEEREAKRHKIKVIVPPAITEL